QRPLIERPQRSFESGFREPELVATRRRILHRDATRAGALELERVAALEIAAPARVPPVLEVVAHGRIGKLPRGDAVLEVPPGAGQRRPVEPDRRVPRVPIEKEARAGTGGSQQVAAGAEFRERPILAEAPSETRVRAGPPFLEIPPQLLREG